MDLDQLLIKEVQRHPCLYDLHSDDYRVLRYKSYAWEEVSKCLDVNEAECRKRWRVLRDYYQRSKRIDNDSSGSGKKVWKYAKLMTFLDKVPNTSKDDNFSNELLIREVQKHPCLYDTHDEDHSFLEAKNHAWDQISQNLQTDELLCRRKWRVLRDCYKRYNKVQENGKKKNWKYTEMMSFLDNDLNFKQQSIEDSVEIVESFKSEIEAVEEDSGNEVESNAPAEFISYSPLMNSHPNPLSTAGSPTQSIASLQDEEIIKNKFQELLDTVAENIKKTCNKIENEERSSTATFFASLALKIKEANLPMSEVLGLEAEVSEIVYQRIQNYLERGTRCEGFVCL